MTIQSFTIRREQLEAITRTDVQRFERRAGDHLRKYFPEVCSKLGDQGVLEAVRHGFARASAYGLATERDLFRYLTVMFIFGRDFDRDPGFPWARQTLRSELAAADKTDLLRVHALRDRAQAQGYVGID